MKIAIIGATGFLGEPVARKLNADGHIVRVISRNMDQARAKLGEEFEYAQADLEDFSSVLLEDALDGCDAVHMNLNSNSDDQCKAVEWHGVEKVAKVARKLNMKKIGWVTGNYEANINHPWSRRGIQSRGIQALHECGVPYMIFGCTWFMESLNFFIKDNAALMIGEQPLPWHWLNVEDYTSMVARAYDTRQADHKHFVMHGPEPKRMLDALQTYCSIAHPRMKVDSMSIDEATALSREPGKAWLARAAAFMAKFETYGEFGNPKETNAILGTPKTTIEAWAHHHAEAGK